MSAVRAVALVDGEHYPDVVRQALELLPYEWVGAILVGGTEKLRGSPEYGVPVVSGFAGADIVVDLSDEPVLGPSARLRWASRALAAGLPYVGADFRFDPPRLEPFELPSVSVIGTGKRVGKTAVTGHLARLLARDRSVVVVAMGRGGPAEPELVSSPPTVAELVARSRAGDHAASDHLEIAATCGVTTSGCRRAGGGLAGAVFTSNVSEGARLAAGQSPDVVVFDGSGAAIPPIDVDARVLVAHDLAGLNAYRALVSDLVLTMSEDVAAEARALGRPVVRFGLRLRPLERLEGRVAVFTTGAAPLDHIEGDVVFSSRSLADRAELAAQLERVEADTYLVELKAAAIDLVATHALERGRRVVLAANDVVADGLDEFVLALLRERVRA